MDIRKFSDSVMDLARKLKLDDLELLVRSYRNIDARIENREVTLTLDEDIFAAAIRVIKAGRLCYVPITEPNMELLATGIRIALQKAGPAPFDSFARLDRVRSGLVMSDPAVVALLADPVRIKELAAEMVRRAWDTGKVETLEGGVGVVVEERLLGTLHGREPAMAQRTLFAAGAEVNSKDYDYVTGRDLPALDAVTVLGAQVANSIPAEQSSPEAEGLKGKSVPAILHPEMLGAMLGRLVAEHLYASTVQDGMSKYKLGDRVCSELVTLYDDATAPYGRSTFPTDDEGTPSRRNTVIENGVLKTFLYDVASAKKDGVESTGNGRRRPVLIEEEHEAPVRCGVNDLYLRPGATPLSEIVAGIPNGVMVKAMLGFHTANRTTGDFAATAHIGRVIRGGKMVALPEPGRWAVKGNALDCLKSVSAVSRETLRTPSGVLPWVKVDLMVA